jgi:hypothetical protein
MGELKRGDVDGVAATATAASGSLTVSVLDAMYLANKSQLQRMLQPLVSHASPLLLQSILNVAIECGAWSASLERSSWQRSGHLLASSWSLLSARDLLRGVELCCRKWCQYSRNGIGWTSVSASWAIEYCSNPFVLTLLMHRFRNLTSITIYRRASTLKKLLSLPRLRSLYSTIDWLSDDIPLLNGMISLRHLQLSVSSYNGASLAFAAIQSMVSLETLHFRSSVEIISPDQLIMLSSMTTLTDLSLAFCDALDTGLKYLPVSLRTLTLHSQPLDGLHELSHLSFLSSLTLLSKSHKSPTLFDGRLTALSCIPSLQTLILRGGNLNEHALPAIASSIPTLKHLEIDVQESSSNMDLVCQEGSFTKLSLTHFTLKNQQVSSNFMRMVSNLPKLGTLDLSDCGCAYFETNVLQSLTLSSLHTLILRKFRGLTAHGFLNCATRLPLLHTLDISFTTWQQSMRPGQTRMLSRLLSTLPSLRSLMISLCLPSEGGIWTDDAIAYLKSLPRLSLRIQ